MSTALASRFVHVDVDVDLNDWIAWAIDAGIQVEVMAFLRWRPNLLHSFDPARNERTFPCPRTWQFASNILAANPPADILYDLLTGTVGEGAAAELLGFLRIWQSLPNPDGVLMDPQSAVVPTDPATLYALTGALVRKASGTTIDNLMSYTSRLPAEFGVLLVKDMLRLKPELANTRAYITWASNHADVLL
jgi:hypothetical protein